MTALAGNELVAVQGRLATVLSAAAALPHHVDNLAQLTVGPFLTSRVTCLDENSLRTALDASGCSGHVRHANCRTKGKD